MIRIFLGNLGSGKTASAVREVINDGSGRKTYTNIKLKDVKNAILIRPENVVKKTENEKKTSFDLNIEFWQKQKKPLNILWDEIHLTANSRTSMSKINIIFSRFITMARRITGFDEKGYGHLIFIAQSERTIDVNIKELSSEIRYHIGHFNVECLDCHAIIPCTSETEQIERCCLCHSWHIRKRDFFVEVMKFNSWEKYINYRMGLRKSRAYFDRYIINDIGDFFRYYDTMQIDNIWDNYLNN